MTKVIFSKDIKIRIACFVIIVLAMMKCILAHSHEHPSFKYSREANEQFEIKKDAHNHKNKHSHDFHSHTGEDHDSHHHHHQKTEVPDPHITKNTIDLSKVWFNAISATLFISSAPFVLLYIIPLDNSEGMKPRLKVILAFASGGLLGDAFLHLIPHAIQPHTSDHDEHKHHSHGGEHRHGNDMTVGLWVLGGIIAFLSVEKLVRLLKGHSHGSCSAPATTKKNSIKADNKRNKKGNANNDEADIDISGYLNLVADFAHNFTDGLAIGASYLAGNSIGLITTATIFLHEVPHEIGDFAILIKSGCSRYKAMMLQLLTAVGALAGTSLALYGASDENTKATWVLPFTAGGFIYIATVSVLPELLEESTKLFQSIKEITALLSGVGLMVLISNFE